MTTGATSIATALQPYFSSPILTNLLLLLLFPCSYVIAYLSSMIMTSQILYINLPITLLLFWLCIEILSYIYFVYTKQRLQQVTKPKHPLDQLERMKLFWNCLHTIDDFYKWSEGWFYYKKDHTHPQFKDIKRENLARWFAWAFWHDHLDVVLKDKVWTQEINWMLQTAEDWFQVQFSPGFNTDLVCIRLNLDPVEAQHRPFIIYIALYIITSLFNIFFLQLFWNYTYSVNLMYTTTPGVVWGGLLGILHEALYYCKRFLFITTSSSFINHHHHHHQHHHDDKVKLKNIAYFYRASSNNDKTTTPLVFLHGIGIGVISYAEFVHQLSKLDRPIFLVELPYVSMHMVEHVPTASETVQEIQVMLDSFGYDKAVFVSHSLGTGVSSWIMNLQPELISGLVMIDPICFLLHYHYVAFNFVHRIPRTIMEYIMHYGAAKELYISNYISRHFQWFETIYFSQPTNSSSLPTLPISPLDLSGPLTNATVFLSEKDGIVGSSAVYQYLQERGVDVRIMHHLEHAMFLSDSSWKKKIANQIDIIAKKADATS